MKIITSIARFFSYLCSPLMMGTYGIAIAMWLSFLCYSTPKAKLVVTAVTFIATCIIPIIAIFILHKVGVVKNPRLNDREDRTVPYIISIVCYCGVGIYYHFVNAPVWLSMFVFGGALALLILTCINRKWKISGHATGMGGLVAMLFFLMCSGNCPLSIQWEFIAGILLAGIVCTSRLVLQRHTLMQVATGFLNGFACVYILAWFCQGSPIPQL